MGRIGFILLFILFYCYSGQAQISFTQTGKVHYLTIPSNESVTKRNDSIASFINKCIKEKRCNFPDILLMVNDQDSLNKLSNYEEILVFYRRQQAEFTDVLDLDFKYPKEHVVIILSLFDQHYTKSQCAIEYACQNIKRLKKNEKHLYKKELKDDIDDDDYNCFQISCPN